MAPTPDRQADSSAHAVQAASSGETVAKSDETRPNRQMPAATRPGELSGRPLGPTYVRYAVLLWLCLAATIAYISRNSLGVAESTIRKDLGLTEYEMGLAMSAFFFSYALVQLPTGWLADYLGSRKALPLFAIVWSLATALMGLAVLADDSRYVPLVGWSLPLLVLIATRFINGVAQAGLFPGCMNTVSKWFSRHERALPSGALASFMSLGGALGGIFTGWMLDELEVPWEWLFAGFAVPGLVWAVGYYFWFRDTPEEHASVSQAELAAIQDRTFQLATSEASAANSDTLGATNGTPSEDVEPLTSTPSSKPMTAPRPRTPWLAIVSSPAMLWICGQQFFRAAGYIFFASWFPTYLQETRNVSLEASGILTALPLMAVVVGGIVGGKFSDALLQSTGSRSIGRRVVSAACLLLCAALIFVAYFIADPLLAVGVISLGLLFYSLGGPASYAITIDMGGEHVASVFSTMNMSGNIGAALFPILVPKFKDATSWDAVLLLFGGMFVAAAICWLMLKPEGTIFDQSLVRRELDSA